MDTIKIGLLSVSDRASKNIYADQGIPTLKDCLNQVITNPIEYVEFLIPDEQQLIEEKLIGLVDTEHCHLVLTTGGTGSFPRDVTPDATLKIADRVITGLGEHMRRISLHFTPTAILSRQLAVIRQQSLIINLPGKPKAIVETLHGVANNPQAFGLLTILPCTIDAIGGPTIQINNLYTAPLCS